jgi:hypothetical protein
MSDEAGIWSATARWDDAEAMATLLDSLPSNIAANIKEGHKEHQFFYGFRHDGDSAYWVNADPINVEIWTLRPCSEVEAAIMWALLQQTETDRGMTISRAVKLYRDATGRETSYIQ